MDLLLTHGYFLEEDPKEQAIMKPYAPLGILYLSSHLERKGFGVEIYDSTFGSMRELKEVLRDGPPSVLGIYANLMTRGNVLRIIAAAKAAGWKVVLGGPEPFCYIRQYLDAGADIIVQGEGEVALEELLAAFRNSPADEEALGRIDGIAFRRGDGSDVAPRPRALIPDLDAQPWPDRERIDTRRYLKVWRDHHGVGSVSVITARGCPYHCRWCSHSTYGKTHRRRSPQGVAEEVAWIAERYSPDMLWMADDVFTIHPGWLLRYTEEMRRRGLRIPFECITRADRLDPRSADALAALGCFRVWVGSESGSQRILDAMERDVTVAQVRRAVELCRERGIQSGMFLMWGYEGEEPRDIEATVEHVKNSQPDIFLTTVSYPIKGTPYFDEVESKIVPGGPWGESTDRDAHIRGRHSRRYFRFADQLLRSEVALAKIRSQGAPASEYRTVQDLREQIDTARRGLRESYREVEA